MDLRFSGDDLAFLGEVQAFIEKNWPVSVRKSKDMRDRFKRRNAAEQGWFDALVKAGWSVPNWPEAYGGCGWSVTQKYIWDQETVPAGCPQMSAFGARMLAPVIYTWGTKEQCDLYLPAIREARITWCQGYSEPGAGSDLAALTTTAVRDGSYYIVNGTKTWTTGAHVADWMFCLVRTDTKTEQRQQGISFILLNMKSAGVSVNPIITLGGQHSINSVVLDNVRVPILQRIGEENEGWTYAKGLLAHERTGIAGVALSQVRLQRLKEIVASDEELAADDDFISRMYSLEVELTALSMTELRVISQVAEGGAPGPESSILKIKGTEISQRLHDLAVESLGYYALPYPPDHEALDNEGPIGPVTALSTLSDFLSGRAQSIFGGSNEIQRNIIAKAVLGL